MLKTRTVTHVICLLLLILTAPGRIDGQTRIDADEIESLIDEWNSANNTRNFHSFEKLYGETVTLNGERLTKSRAIAAKRQLFRSRPWFRQRIVTEISTRRYASGLVKCEFTKEVFEQSHWKKYPSYLLVSLENNRYSIVAEHDVVGEQLSRRKKSTGDGPTNEREDTGQSLKSVDTSVVQVPPALPPMEHPDSLEEDLRAADDYAGSVETKLRLTDIDALLSGLDSLGDVTIPRGYVFMLIALLCVGGVMIFIADSVQSRRKRRRVKMPVTHVEAEHVVRDFRVQAAFENFVMTLFDPLFFKSFRPKAEYVYSGKAIEAEKGPDLILDYRQKETHARFAITCQYYQHSAKSEVQLLSGERQAFIKEFEADRGLDVYYVLGFGGKPDDPRELFFVPAKEVEGEYMTRAQLRQYSKSGMFYYNGRRRRIQ